MNNIQNLHIFGWFSFNQQQALKMYNEKRTCQICWQVFFIKIAFSLWLPYYDCFDDCFFLIGIYQDCFSLRLFFLKDCFFLSKALQIFGEEGWDWGQKFARSKQILGVFSNFFKKILKIFQLFFALKTAIFANTRQDAPAFSKFPKKFSKNF